MTESERGDQQFRKPEIAKQNDRREAPVYIKEPGHSIDPARTHLLALHLANEIRHLSYLRPHRNL